MGMQLLYLICCGAFVCVCRASDAAQESHESVSTWQNATVGALSSHLSEAQLHVLSATFNYAIGLKLSCEESLQDYQPGRHPAQPSCLTLEILKSTDAAHAAIRGMASGRAVQGFDEALDQVLDPLEIDFFREVVQLSQVHSSFAMLASHVAAEERSLLSSVKRVAKLMTYTADKARTTDKQSWVDALFVARSLVGQVGRAAQPVTDFEPAGIGLLQQALINASAFIPEHQHEAVQTVLTSCKDYGHTYLKSFKHVQSAVNERMQRHNDILHKLHDIYKAVSSGSLQPYEVSEIPGAFWNNATGLSTPAVHAAPDILERINYEIGQILRPRSAAQVRVEGEVGVM